MVCLFMEWNLNQLRRSTNFRFHVMVFSCKSEGQRWWYYASCFHDELLCLTLNTLRPKQNGRRFADDTFKRIFVNENVRISIKISLKFAPKGPINNNPALVQIMAWRRSGDKPLSEPIMVSLLTHICVTRPQWVNTFKSEQNGRHFTDDILKCNFQIRIIGFR